MMRSAPAGIAAGTCRLDGMSAVLANEQVAKQLSGLAEEFTDSQALRHHSFDMPYFFSLS
jgi:hypothetical protein